MSIANNVTESYIQLHGATMTKDAPIDHSDEWVEICPYYMGPHCNEDCARRLRYVFSHFDKNMPDADIFCPIHADIQATAHQAPYSRYEVMHQSSECDEESAIVLQEGK